jgi:predicted enzyme related to lactoylglutathione lyase
MELVSIRIITADPQRLAGFYGQVTGIAPTWATADFAELVTPRAVLAIADERTLQQFAAGAARPGENRSVIVELKVDDVDAVFARIAPHLGEVLQPPTTMPWGNRSLLFRDPDGNLVNLFTPVTADAKRRAARA